MSNKLSTRGHEQKREEAKPDENQAPSWKREGVHGFDYRSKHWEEPSHGEGQILQWIERFRVEMTLNKFEFEKYNCLWCVRYLEIRLFRWERHLSVFRNLQKNWTVLLPVNFNAKCRATTSGWLFRLSSLTFRSRSEEKVLSLSPSRSLFRKTVGSLSPSHSLGKSEAHSLSGFQFCRWWRMARRLFKMFLSRPVSAAGKWQPFVCFILLLSDQFLSLLLSHCLGFRFSLFNFYFDGCL